MATNGFLERDSLSMSSGRWASIEKLQYRHTDIEHAVIVPLYQAAALGVAVGVASSSLVALTGGSFELCAGVAVASTATTFTLSLFDAIRWARTALESEELWESESAQRGGAESATVRVELVEQATRGGMMGRVVYDELSTDAATLASIAQPGTQLSKRGLMSLGLSDTGAMSLVAQLLALGYATRSRDNEPARWTSKGKALCRAFGGGGGGGVRLSTSENQRIDGVGGEQ